MASATGSASSSSATAAPSAAQFSGTPIELRLDVPLHGADTDDVLRSAGFGDDEIAALRADGVVGVRSA